MLNALLPAALAALAGVSIVVQQALNANLRVELSSAVWSGFASYLVGLLCMACLPRRRIARAGSNRRGRRARSLVGVERHPVRSDLHCASDPAPQARRRHLHRSSRRGADARLGGLRPLRHSRPDPALLGSSAPSRRRATCRRRRPDPTLGSLVPVSQKLLIDAETIGDLPVTGQPIKVIEEVSRRSGHANRSAGCRKPRKVALVSGLP